MDQLITTVVDLVREHPRISGWTFAISLAVFVGSLVAMPLVVARMRRDYFVRRRTAAERAAGHVVLRWTGLVVKNLVGLILVLAGIAMLVLPGQGILTILVGVSLLNFPGKHALELRFARQRHIRRTITWIRARAGRPPLILPDPGDDG